MMNESFSSNNIINRSSLHDKFLQMKKNKKECSNYSPKNNLNYNIKEKTKKLSKSNKSSPSSSNTRSDDEKKIQLKSPKKNINNDKNILNFCIQSKENFSFRPYKKSEISTLTSASFNQNYLLKESKNFYVIDEINNDLNIIHNKITQTIKQIDLNKSLVLEKIEKEDKKIQIDIDIDKICLDVEKSMIFVTSQCEELFEKVGKDVNFETKVKDINKNEKKKEELLERFSTKKNQIKSKSKKKTKNLDKVEGTNYNDQISKYKNYLNDINKNENKFSKTIYENIYNANNNYQNNWILNFKSNCTNSVLSQTSKFSNKNNN